MSNSSTLNGNLVHEKEEMQGSHSDVIRGELLVNPWPQIRKAVHGSSQPAILVVFSFQEIPLLGTDPIIGSGSRRHWLISPPFISPDKLLILY